MKKGNNTMANPGMTSPLTLAAAVAFTDAYRTHENDHPALREAHCLRAQFPALLADIREGDLLAGRLTRGALVGFELQETGIGYGCRATAIQALLADPGLPPDDRVRLQGVLDYWRERTTLARTLARDQGTPPAEVAAGLRCYNPSVRPGGSKHFVAEVNYRWASVNPDFDQLLSLGIAGLKARVAARRERARQAHEDDALFEALTMTLDLLADVCRHYAHQAAASAAGGSDLRRRAEFQALATSLARIATAPPATFRDAVQLVWLYALVATVMNFGRADVYLGDVLAADLESGRTTEADALRLLQSWWRLMGDTLPEWAGRVILGGVGRRNPANADRFALLALEATRTVGGLVPQTSLRVDDDTAPTVWARALDTIGQGGVFPILFSDTTNVPGIAAAFGVSPTEAEQYVASDCGEFSIAHRSIGSPNGTISLAKVLEVTLFNGVDPVSRQCLGLRTGDFAQFATFAEFWDAFARQLTAFMAVLADRQVCLIDELAESAPHLFWTLLYDDCLERGRSLFAGGACYRGVLTETYGNITVADSMTAIRQVVFEARLLTPQRLLEALAADFEGSGTERQLLLSAPKFGNDDPVADGMAKAVHDLVCGAASAQAQRLGLDFALADLINASGHVSLGQLTGATPDGRRAGAPLTNGDNPSAGSDRRGVTALLNSMRQLDTCNIGGQTCYLKFSPGLFRDDRPRLEALLRTFLGHGGSSAMITLVGRDDLENALRQPERFRNLMVRVGGFNARFVDLDRAMQQEIIARTLH